MTKESNVSDPIMVMTMLKEAKGIDLELEYRNVGTYVFLLRSRGVPFSYSFHLYPMPISDNLNEDLTELKRAQFIDYSSPIFLTSEGEKYLDKWIIPSGMRKSIRQGLNEFRGHNPKMLFDAVYESAVSV